MEFWQGAVCNAYYALALIDLFIPLEAERFNFPSTKHDSFFAFFQSMSWISDLLMPVVEVLCFPSPVHYVADIGLNIWGKEKN